MTPEQILASQSTLRQCFRAQERNKTMGKFKFFTGDRDWLSYGGVWCRHIEDRRFHFIELTNMDDACGRDNEGRPTYSVTLSEVDLEDVPESGIADALRCHGMEQAEQLVHLADDAIAEMVRSYGIASPLHEESTNNAHKGIAACRAESYRLTRDAQAYRQAMARPVNRIGSTAREFGRGDLMSGLIRSARAGDPGAKIAAKMYVNSDGQTLGGRISDGELEALRSVV